ncbi:Chemotaxis protein CheA [Thalassocella blandensis]|nr:Chemotaxis protein CheA [Thalassocella blandensis]
MKKTIKLAGVLNLFVLLTAALPSPADTFPKDIKFQHILDNRDIVVGEVRAILQDSQGYMWFGGWNSLVRFDGYDVSPVYLTTQEAGKVALVPTTMTTHLYEDSRKNIWVGTAQGLLRFDPVKNEMLPIEDMSSQAVKISKSHIMGITEAPDGRIVTGSLDGMFIVDPTNNQYISKTWNPDNWLDPQHPATPSMPCAFTDRDGDIWLCSEKGIDKYDIQNERFTHIVPDNTNNDRVANWVKDIAQDKTGKFWLATELGVLHYDLVSGDVKRYVHDPDDKSSIGQNNIWDILIDSKGRIWFASDQGGLNVYNAEKDNFIRYKTMEGKASAISSNVVRTVMEDSSGDLWLGFYPEGVDFFDQSTTAITAYTNNPNDIRSISHNSVLSVSEDRHGNFWLGTDGGGLNFYDREKDTFTSYQSDPGDPHTIATNAVLTTFLDSENTLWMGHWDGGVTQFDLSTGTITRLPMYSPSGVFKDSAKALNSRHVWSIYEDKRNNLWFGTHSGGLNKYDRDARTFYHYWADPNDATTLNSEWVWSMYEDSKGNFWIGTNSGLALMDRDNQTFQQFKPDPNDSRSLSEWAVLAIHEDHKGRLWVGTNVGLNLYDYKTQSFTHVTTEDGLNNDSIRRILEDKEGSLWLGTANGVSSYNPDTGKIKNFNRDGGELVGSFNYGAGVATKTGEIVFGGVNGLRIYKPDELQDNPNVPKIAFTKLKIYSDIIGVDGADGILERDLNFTDTIKLDYTKSMFEIDFAALNFRDSGKNQYAYILEGFDDEWLDVGGQRSAKYTNLDAGTYVFRVKASNNDGVWNTEGKSLTIVQMPPWWETWWAYTFYALSVVGIFGLALQHQARKRKRVENQNRILEVNVAERTRELQQKNKDIQGMLSHMRQGLFTVEKGGAIHPEYSQYLETIFETEKVAGRNFMEFLFSRSHLGKDELDQVREATGAILGESEMNFDFNAHLLFSEYDADIEGQRKHLSLDWNPIVADDIVAKLMVSVRDITQLKKMENEARTQKRELDIISQLLNINAKKFNSFENSVRKFVQENRNKIIANKELNTDVMATLFRNMHTIKGNSRTYGFSYLSEVAHTVEASYSALTKAEGAPWKPQRLLDELTLVESSLAEYADIFHRVLGRGNEGPQGSSDGIWLDGKALRSINSAISSIQLHTGSQLGLPELHVIANNDASCNTTLDEVLDDIINSLPSIAEQLHKPHPKVYIDARHVRIKEEAFELMNNVFSHILRNCVDHGIEKPEEREALGKDAVGNIEVTADKCTDRLDIHVHDDGRGLNISKLHDIGVKLGKWRAEDKVDANDIAQLIFASGVSTSEAITDISGRGVGMDAVNQYIKESGGKVRVNLLPVKQQQDNFCPFEIVVSLPPELYVQLKKAS